MNERIKELAEQARKYARDYVAECKHYGHYMEHNEYELRFEEKFAELIVLECGLLADQYQFEKNTPNPLRVKQLDLVPSEFIKKHFGVEL